MWRNKNNFKLMFKQKACIVLYREESLGKLEKLWKKVLWISFSLFELCVYARAHMLFHPTDWWALWFCIFVQVIHSGVQCLSFVFLTVLFIIILVSSRRDFIWCVSHVQEFTAWCLIQSLIKVAVIQEPLIPAVRKWRAGGSVLVRRASSWMVIIWSWCFGSPCGRASCRLRSIQKLKKTLWSPKVSFKDISSMT